MTLLAFFVPSLALAPRLPRRRRGGWRAPSSSWWWCGRSACARCTGCPAAPAALGPVTGLAEEWMSRGVLTRVVAERAGIVWAALAVSAA